MKAKQERYRFAQATRITAALAVGAAFLGQARIAEAADSRNYDIGQTVNVNINWNSFVAQDFDDYFTYEQFRDAFINAYTRWQHVAGAKIKVRWIGQTTRDPDQQSEYLTDEIFVRANQAHTAGSRLASTFGCDGQTRCTQIVIHRETSGGTRNVYNLWDGGASGSDLESVLVHEVGHALGLDHSPTDGNTMFGSNRFHQRFGPYVDDRSRLVALYGEEDRVGVNMWRSTDEGLTYATFGSAIPVNVKTTNDLDGVRDSSNLILAYTKNTKVPCWIMGTTSGTWDTSKWFCIGGTTSWYGTSIDGESDEYMIAYARPTSDNLNLDVRVSYGTKAQFESGSLTNRSPSGARTYGTPAIAKLGSNTWVLAYSRHSRTDATIMGEIVTRVTTDDGATWSSEVVLNDFYRAESGISIAGQQSSNVRIGFSYAADRDNVVGNFNHRVFRAALSGSTLTYSGVMASGADATRTQPALARAANFYHVGLRGTDAATSLYGSRATLSGTSWTDRIVSMAGTSGMPTTPGLAADKDQPFVYLFTSL